MKIKQTNRRLIRYSITHAAIVTSAVAFGTALSGFINQDYLKILTFEYAVVFAVSFLLAAHAYWLTSRKDLEINVNRSGLTITHKQGKQSFTWDEVKSIKRPSPLLTRWLFWLKQGDNVRIQVNIFDKPQSRSLNSEIQKYI